MSKIINYLKEAKNEMKYVNWPTKSQTVNFTIVVILISFLVAALLGLADLIFTGGLKSLLEKI